MDHEAAGDDSDEAQPPGVEEHFREFIDARAGALLRTAFLLTGDHGHAEDLLQNALIRAHRHWRRVYKDGQPEAYVRKILVNLNTDRWRRRSSHEVATVAASEGGGRGRSEPAVDPFAGYELREELWTALRGLPPKMRAALVLRYFEDLTEAQTAQLLGCSVGTVKSQCSRGLERLRSAYGIGDAGRDTPLHTREVRTAEGRTA